MRSEPSCSHSRGVSRPLVESVQSGLASQAVPFGRLSVVRPAGIDFLNRQGVAPLHRTWPVGAAAPTGEAAGYINDNGLTFPGAPGAGRQLIQSRNITETNPRALQGVSGCLRHHHVLQYAVYQPASRFWTLQAIETSIFLALSVALVASSLWWVNHRVA